MQKKTTEKAENVKKLSEKNYKWEKNQNAKKNSKC